VADVDDSFVAGEHEVLVLPREPRARVPERLRDAPLQLVRHGARRLRAAALDVDGVQEVHDVRRRGVHEQEQWVQRLPPGRRGAVEHADRRVQRHGRHVVPELGEQRAEPQQVRLAAGGALGADDQTAARPQPRVHGGAVRRAVPGEAERGDRRQGLREAADAVRGGREVLAPRGRGHVERVQQGPVVAGEEALGRRGGVGDDAAVHAEGGEQGHGEREREGQEGGDAGHGERHAQRHPHEHGQRRAGRRPEGDPAVVEDERPRVAPPRERVPSPPRRLGRRVYLLHAPAMFSHHHTTVTAPHIGIIEPKVSNQPHLIRSNWCRNNGFESDKPNLHLHICIPVCCYVAIFMCQIDII
jgi:hypothetical protein